MSRFRRKMILTPCALFCEYLESTGTQYIDTGITFTQSQATVEIKFSPTETNDAAVASGSAYNGIVGINSNPQIAWSSKGWGVGNAGSAKPYLPEVGKIYCATWGYDTNAHLYIDGQDTGISRSGTLTVKLFSVADGPTNAKAKLYYCKVTDADGKLTHYFVPCIYRNRYGLWDRVENKFYGNSGASKFKSDRPIPTNPVFYDYIESTGTQYIDTGITFTESQATVEIKFSPTEINGTSPSGTDYSGVAGINSTPQIGWYTKGWTVGNAGSAKPYLAEIGTTYIASWGYGTNAHLYIDGQDTELVRSGTMTLKLFWIANGPDNAKAKLYYCKVTDINGNVIHYYVPCTSGGAEGLFDKTENTFYENAGTGQFALGSRL